MPPSAPPASRLENETQIMTSNGDIETPASVVTARAGTYYRWTRYIIALAVLGWGIASIYDGFFRYPRENQDWIDQEKKAAIKNNRDPNKVDVEKLPHPGLDVPLNRLFGVTFPPLAIVLLIRWLYISRGEYRLENNTVHIPGHPPVPTDAITEIDKRLWDRKGIAYISYELPDGTKGTFKLDDFVYERKGTDEIYDRIVAAVAPESADAQESEKGEEQETSSS
jgi:hypothetical protein